MRQLIKHAIIMTAVFALRILEIDIVCLDHISKRLIKLLFYGR